MVTVAIDADSKRLAKRLGNNVAHLLEKRGMTRTELANNTGLTRTFIWDVIRANHVVNFADVKKIADALGVGIDFLLA